MVRLDPHLGQIAAVRSGDRERRDGVLFIGFNVERHPIRPSTPDRPIQVGRLRCLLGRLSLRLRGRHQFAGGRRPRATMVLQDIIEMSGPLGCLPLGLRASGREPYPSWACYGNRTLSSDSGTFLPR